MNPSRIKFTKSSFSSYPSDDAASLSGVRKQNKGSRTRPHNKTDVLLGRGRGCTGTEGNTRYLKIIEEKALSYLDARNRKEQHKVKLDIIEEVRKYGGRFLQPSEKLPDNEWCEAPLQVVLNKIAQVCTPM